MCRFDGNPNYSSLRTFISFWPRLLTLRDHHCVPPAFKCF
ncbi:hypothetical protein H3S90_08575 [Bartonella sp. W8097]|nr:hypothetical protein [Bartonella apihabitans]MBI0026282.1 hypothetical protein [Bartonella apihabitans]